ncbi:MAG: DNA/RNA nuclease SfsA [candidate division WOR-3 bacterium]|nr:DNA/RNA nuclease SfsA [candidate division WOR-3 bacterium]
MNLIIGKFLKRLNRFTCECLINNKKIKAYLPNPGRLWELLLPNKILYLKKSDKKNKLPYVIYGVRKNNQFVLLHTGYTNKIVEKLIKEKRIKGLETFQIIKREAKINNHRIDFLLKRKDKEFFLEAKSVTLFKDKLAMFPDAPTERGKRHLFLLSKNRGIILFIIYSPKVLYFLPDFHTDFSFAQTLYQLRDKIKIKAISVKIDKNLNFQFIRKLKIPWKTLKKEGKDRGVYLIIGELKRDRKITISQLGEIKFKKGFYIYVGKAMNNLSKRIGRHLRKIKKKRWHIDYLIDSLNNLKPIPIRTAKDLECLLAKDIKKIANSFIKNFGCSDCQCDSHLYYFKENPFIKEKFIDLILKYRLSYLI